MLLHANNVYQLPDLVKTWIYMLRSVVFMLLAASTFHVLVVSGFSRRMWFNLVAVVFIYFTDTDFIEKRYSFSCYWREIYALFGAKSEKYLILPLALAGIGTCILLGLFIYVYFGGHLSFR